MRASITLSEPMNAAIEKQAAEWGMSKGAAIRRLLQIGQFVFNAHRDRQQILFVKKRKDGLGQTTRDFATMTELWED